MTVTYLTLGALAVGCFLLGFIAKIEVVVTKHEVPEQVIRDAISDAYEAGLDAARFEEAA